MRLEVINDRNDGLVAELTAVWKASVLATHDFLSKEEVEEIEPYLPSALKDIPNLVVAFEGDAPIGFLGVQEKIEMLFVTPDYIGKGVGKELITYAIDDLNANEVSVNEQSPKAKEFYEHFGFKVYKRTELDEQGRPYPILYMKRDSK